jgi:hypothetical protein
MLHIRRQQLAITVPRLFNEEVSMPMPASNKRGDQDQQEFVMIWLSILTTVLVLVIAGFVGIVF